MKTTYDPILGKLRKYDVSTQPTPQVDVDFCISIEYARLKELRDAGQLVPGLWHRIVDYTTTVANDSEARSAGHPFDVLVMALTNNKLLEEGYVINSERDIDGYFANSKLGSWKISYCLDNDTNRFMWADAENGKGVIYRMADEWYNCAPYDFKNIQFKRYKVTDDSDEQDTGLNGQYIGTNAEMSGLSVEDYEDFIWCYTYSFGSRTSTPIDASLIGFNSDELGEGYGYKGYYGGNIIKPCSCYQSIDEEQHSVFCLNNVIWFTNNAKYRASVSGTLVKDECINMTLSGNSVIVGYDNQNVIMGDGCYQISIQDGGFLLTFGQDCYDMQFGQGCYIMQFGQYCQRLTFGQGCNYMQFGQGCSGMQFGQGCSSMQFGQDCYDMQFGQNCGGLTFGQGCSGMQFGQILQLSHIRTILPRSHIRTILPMAHIRTRLWQYAIRTKLWWSHIRTKCSQSYYRGKCMLCQCS